MGADGDGPRRFALAEAVFGLEPLPQLVNEADERDRGFAHLGRERDDLFEDVLRRRVQDRIIAEYLQPLNFRP